MKQPPHPCCVPSKERAEALEASKQASACRKHIRSGSTVDAIKLAGGEFLMGTDTSEGFPADGEGPVRRVTVDGFYIDKYPVTNEAFAEFAHATQYKTDAERFGWSFV